LARPRDDHGFTARFASVRLSFWTLRTAYAGDARRAHDGTGRKAKPNYGDGPMVRDLGMRKLAHAAAEDLLEDSAATFSPMGSTDVRRCDSASIPSSRDNGLKVLACVEEQGISRECATSLSAA
jgi:hypothetical protein